MALSTVQYDDLFPMSTETANGTIEDSSSKEEFYENLSLGIQATMAFIGCVGNTLTFVTLRKNGHIFASSVLKLIKNQCILDAIVCLMGAIYVLQPPMWKTYWSETFDIFVCHVSTHFFFFCARDLLFFCISV